MQLDREPEHHHSSPAHQSVLGYIDNHLESETSKGDNEAEKVGKHGFTSLFGYKSCEKVADPSLLVDEPRLHGYTDSCNHSLNKGGCQITTFSAPFHKFEMVKKETKLYTDKTVTEMDTPKTIIYLKEGSYHIVKDICIDEGVYLFDKVLVEKAAEDMKIYNNHFLRDERSLTNEIPVSDGLKSFNINEESLSGVDNGSAIKHSFDGLPEEGRGSNTINENVSNMSAEKNPKNVFMPQEVDGGQLQEHVLDVDKEGSKHRSFSSFLEEGRCNFNATHAVIDDLSDEKSTAGNLLPLHELNSGHSQEHLSCFDCKDDQLQSVNSNSNQPQSFNDSSDHRHSVDAKSSGEQYDQDVIEETNSTSFVLSSAFEEPKQIISTKDFSSNGKVESRIVAFDTGSPAISARNENKGTAESQQSSQVKSASGLEEAANDGPTSSARSSFTHYGHADSNLSGPAFLSGSIAYSGHIPYSGSISLRSDSSATSTRSFAFPILQSEWNSSPVKMAKPDRRHFRKHCGWRSGLLCCRF